MCYRIFQDATPIPQFHFIDIIKMLPRDDLNVKPTYGRVENIRYYDTTLLWGQGFYQKLRFVLVEYGNTKSILVSTDLTVSPLSIIHLYSFRFRIENTFRTLKQEIGGFSYHFWTEAMGKLSHFRKKQDKDPLDDILQEHNR